MGDNPSVDVAEHEDVESIPQQDDPEEPWRIDCQPYPQQWRDPHRTEVKAPHSWLEQVAQEMVDQDIAASDTYRYAVTAGYTHEEAVTMTELTQECPPTRSR